MYKIPLTFDQLPEAVYQLRQEIGELKQLLKEKSVAPVPDADILWTRCETADFLKVSTVTIWSWDKKGILNPRRIGNQVRYLKSEVMAANKSIRK
ncbi:helix-turn-helix domain-containing protein [Spirosoma pollinicola]|uniref:helix-turn-helix domain-containing protein n=1 Tax=Spirosoma pollinicola TaxID=2057025 RepID=UPI0014758E69|nr:helix-turn-helix domain-containing protein [Spirosoma pollinicola]